MIFSYKYTVGDTRSFEDENSGNFGFGLLTIFFCYRQHQKTKMKVYMLPFKTLVSRLIYFMSWLLKTEDRDFRYCCGSGFLSFNLKRVLKKQDRYFPQ